MTKRLISCLLCLLVGATMLAGLALAEPAIAPKYVLPISRIQIDRTSASAYAGRSFALRTKVSPASRAHEAVSWASSDESVAVVDQSGVVTTLSPGAASISATVMDGETPVTAYCALTVKGAKVVAFKLETNAITLAPGDTFVLNASSFLPAYAYDKTLSFKSQNAGIASVGAQTGVVTGVALGTTRIRVSSSNGKLQYATVTVTDEVRATKVVLSSTAKTASYGQTFELRATVLPAGAIEADQKVAWSSSNSAVATVDDDGLVTVVAPKGSATITATTPNGRKGTCKVTAKFIATRKVSLDATALALDVGGERQLTATVAPANASNRDAAWSSSNAAVATVEDGRVVALAAGTATITASAGGQRAACKVTVRSSQLRTVTVTATGDITVGGDPRRPAPASEAYYEKLYAQYGGGFLSALKDTFSGADEVTLVNLESNFTTSSQAKQKSYVLRAKPAYVDVLTRAGVDVVGHANNHMLDFGTVGMRSTRSAVTGAGMGYCSGGTTSVQTVNGVKVGFAAYNATGGAVLNAMKNGVKKLRASADVVVVSIHWGSEYAYGASTAQRNLGRAAIAAGADLVVGHHPHVVSGIEKYQGKYIVYSLGTLSSALLTPDDMDAFVFQQTFTVDSVTGLVESAKVKLIPCSMSSDEHTNDARATVMTGSARTRVLNKIKYYSRAFAATVPDSAFE